MRQRDQERFRKLLLDKRTEVWSRVADARSSEDAGDEIDAPDLADRALSTISRDLLFQLSAGERQILRAIDDALVRLDDGSFGSCVNCGSTIQVGRLQAVPWARHCIECQELQDQGKI